MTKISNTIPKLKNWTFWKVTEWRWPLPPPTHLPVGKTPLVGVLPYYSVGRTQLPLSHKLTPSSLPPYSMFMTEVTSMAIPSMLAMLAILAMIAMLAILANLRLINMSASQSSGG